MKTLIGMRLAILLLGTGGVTLQNVAGSELFSFTNLNRAIPEGSVFGVTDSRSITSSIVRIASARLKLKLAGQFNGDLYCYLRQESATRTNLCVLLNRPGRATTNALGYADAGLNVTFDDSAAGGDIHFYRNVTVPAAGTPLLGTWQPDGRKVDPFSVTQTSPRTNSLAAFLNGVGSGTWSLFLADVEPGGSNMLTGWELEIAGTVVPAVIWPTPADLLYGAALGPTQLNATSSVPGTFSYSPPAGTLLGAGSNQILSVTFTPTDLGSYSLVTNTVNIHVQKKALTITANSTNKVYGQTLTLVGTEFTSSGLVNGDAVTSVILTSAGSAATATVTGSPYAIVPSGAVGSGLANYSISYLNGVLTVSNKALTITANSTNKVYGQTLALAGSAFTSSGLVNGDAVTSVILTSAGSAATATVTGSPYAIVPSGAVGSGLANYSISYLNGVLTVSNKALTITANSTNKVYGQTLALAGSAFTSSGLVNGDAVTSVILTSAGSAATATATGSPYAIAPSGAVGSGLANYSINYTNGVLTITPAGTSGVLSSSANPALPGSNITFTCTLTIVPAGAGVLDGAVQFTLNGTNAGSPVPVTNASSSYTRSLPVGSYAVAAQYLGSSNLTASSLSLPGSQLVNTPPVAGSDTIDRWPASGTKVAVAALLANDADADGDPVSFVSFAPTSVQGGALSLYEGWIVYTPLPGFTNADSFSYTIADGRGAPVNGTVLINVRSTPAISAYLAVTVLGNGDYRIHLDAIPDHPYRLQYSVDLQNPAWIDLMSGSTDTNGSMEFVDHAAGQSRFYRSAYP